MKCPNCGSEDYSQGLDETGNRYSPVRMCLWCRTIYSRKAKKKTNADRIRAMSDERLADYIYNLSEDDWVDDDVAHARKEATLKWLKQEVE